MIKATYLIDQNGIKFNLITQIINNQIQLDLIEINTEYPCIYKGAFSLQMLKQISNEFDKMSNITQAHDFIKQIIENEKISIDYSYGCADLLLFLNGNYSPINFKINLANNKPINDQGINNIPPNFQDIKTNNFTLDINNNQNNYQINNNNYTNSLLGKSKYELTLALSPKKDNDSLNLSPLKNNYNNDYNNNNNINDYNYNDYNNNNDDYNNVSQNQYSPTSPKTTDFNSPSSSPIKKEFIESDMNNEVKMLKNENNILKSNIDQLKNELEQEKLKSQKINEQLMAENTTLKNSLNALSEKNKKYASIENLNLDAIKGDIIKSKEELELLSKKLCYKCDRICFNLVFKATIDSDQAEAFHYKCDPLEKSLILIESTKGARFGGFTSCSWGGDKEEKYDDSAFVFSLDKLKIFDILPGEKAIACYPKFGPVFLGCQIKIYDNFFTKGGSTYFKGINYDTDENYELSGGEQKYGVKELEVYEIKLE